MHDDGTLSNGCEAGCGTIDNATCETCTSSSASGCTSLTCDDGYSNGDSDPTTGCSSGAELMAGGDCSGVNTYCASGLTCYNGSCQVELAAGGDCSADHTYCGGGYVCSMGFCSMCYDHGHCDFSTRGLEPFCGPEAPPGTSQVCHQCRNDLDCAGPDLDDYCVFGSAAENDFRRWCRECRYDDDCPDGQYCSDLNMCVLP